MRTQRYLLFFIVVSLFLSSFAHAIPRQIIIIRHADKLDQEEAGPALSAKGLLRSLKFAFYFMDKFGEPDFIVAADDQKISGKEIAIRSIQTVAPLANMMQVRHPEKDYPILHPYPSDSYEDLADLLLTDPKFDDKLVLVCWSHKRIAKLVAALGVLSPVPVWPRHDYDTVYVLTWQDTQTPLFTEYKNQFPLRFEGDWQEVRKKLFGS